MVLASDLREGMALRIGHDVYRVIEVEARAAVAKMGGGVHARLSNLLSGRVWDQSFRPQEKLETVELQKGALEFLFSDGKTCTFLRTDTYDQVELPAGTFGVAATLLAPGAEFQTEFYDGEPVRVHLPETVDARASSTAEPTRSQQEQGRKEATLENGLRIQVPLFVAPGEMVRIEVSTGRYVERVRTERKKGT